MSGRNWRDVRAEMIASGRVTEEGVQAAGAKLRARQRAYRLAEIRKNHGMSQQELAREMHVSQTRVSAIERGQLDRAELATVSAYVRALGGRVRVVADIDDETLTIG